MQTLNGKMARFIGASTFVAGVPFSLVILFFSQLADRFGGRHNDDTVVFALMTLAAYVLAMLSLSISAGYFGYMRLRYKLKPKSWHLLVLALLTSEVAVPILYFTSR